MIKINQYGQVSRRTCNTYVIFVYVAYKKKYVKAIRYYFHLLLNSSAVFSTIFVLQMVFDSVVVVLTDPLFDDGRVVNFEGIKF